MMPITEQDLAGGATEFVKKFNALEELVRRQESQPKVLTSSASDASQAQAAQVHHMCEDQGCVSCVDQAQEIADASYQRGQHDMLEQMDHWLIMAGGEEFRQKIILAAAQGQKLYNESQQVMRVVA